MNKQSKTLSALLRKHNCTRARLTVLLPDHFTSNEYHLMHVDAALHDLENGKTPELKSLMKLLDNVREFAAAIGCEEATLFGLKPRSIAWITLCSMMSMINELTEEKRITDRTLHALRSGLSANLRKLLGDEEALQLVKYIKAATDPLPGDESPR